MRSFEDVPVGALLGSIFLVYMMIFLSIGLFAETPQGVFA